MLIYLVIPFLLLGNALAANADLAHPLTLSELVDIALKNNPETKQAWWHANRAAAAVDSKKSAYYPRIEVETELKNGKEYTLYHGPNHRYATIGANLTLSMLLYDFGERDANVNAAKQALIAANWQTDWAMQKVIVTVLENSYATLYAQDVLQASRISLKEAEKVLNVSRELNKAGLSPISDVYTSQSALSQMQMDVAEQKSLLDIHKGKLAICLGLPIDTPIQLAVLENPPLQQKQQIIELIALAKKQRADLMAKQANLAESYSLQKKSRASFGPKLSLSAVGGVDRSIQHKTKNGNYQFALTLNIPLFVGFDSIYQNRMAYADTQTAIEEMAQLERDIALEVLTHHSSLEAAQEKLAYAVTNLENALKAYEGVLDKYKAGKERIVDVSRAQEQLANARIRHSDVKTEWLVSMAKLAYATGTLGSEKTP